MVISGLNNKEKASFIVGEMLTDEIMHKTKNLTLAQVEEVLAKQGCEFSFNHGLAPGTTLPVRLALREIDPDTRGVFFYYGEEDEIVSHEFLESAIGTLRINPVGFGAH